MKQRYLGCWSAALLIVCSGSLWAQQADSQALQELSRLHRWLGSDLNAASWKSYLRSAELEQQLLLGSKAEVEKVANILAIYGHLPPNLRLPEFVRVERSLDAWLSELIQLSPDQLSMAAKAAKHQFRPISDQDVQVVKGEVQEAMRALDQFLSTGDSANRAAWHHYLRWADLTAEVGKPLPDVTALDSLRRQFNKNEQGLELSYFRRVYRALESYRNVAGAIGVNADQYSSQLDKLAEALEKYRQLPTEENGAVVGDLMGWLESVRQAPSLVALVRQHYWNSNVYAEISAPLLNAAVADSLHQTQAIHSSFMGTDLHGIATTRGQLGLGLIPDLQRAVIELRMNGTTNTSNTGYHGRITIYSSGVTSIDARKRLELDESGLTGHPACANCNTNSSIDGIDARSCLVRKIANRKAHESKGSAEAWASDTAERQVAQQMDERTSELLRQANQSLREKIRNPLLRYDVYPRTLRIQTSQNELQISGLQAAPGQLGAPSTGVPAAPRGEVAVRIHESLIGNFSESILGGETLTDEKLEKLVLDATGNVPDELKVTDDKDPWSITFSPDRPIGVAFRDSRIVVTIRGRRFTRNEQEIRSAINIGATYQIDPSKDRMRLVREGDVHVEFVNRDRLGAAQLAFRTFLKKKFDALFKSEIVSEGFTPKDRMRKLGAFFVSNARSESGWLSVGWQRGSSTPAPSSPKVSKSISSRENLEARLRVSPESDPNLIVDSTGRIAVLNRTNYDSSR